MQVSSDSGIGMAIPLVSDGGNHSPQDWAEATAAIIFQAPSEADKLRECIVACLAFGYTAILDAERQLLDLFDFQCDTPYDIDKFAEATVKFCQAAAEHTPWHDHLMSDEWRDAAYQTIGNHFATAVHVERLLFADAHPENPTAVAYKARYQ